MRDPALQQVLRTETWRIDLSPWLWTNYPLPKHGDVGPTRQEIDVHRPDCALGRETRNVRTKVGQVYHTLRLQEVWLEDVVSIYQKTEVEDSPPEHYGRCLQKWTFQIIFRIRFIPRTNTISVIVLLFLWWIPSVPIWSVVKPVCWIASGGTNNNNEGPYSTGKFGLY